jgi:hypothetical protein
MSCGCLVGRMWARALVGERVPHARKYAGYKSVAALIMFVLLAERVEAREAWCLRRVNVCHF